MTERLHNMLRALRDPVKSRRREALLLLEREWDQPDVERFCAFARNVHPSIGIELCPTLAGASTPPVIGLLAAYAGQSDPTLRDRAFDAMADIPGTLRIPHLVRLLSSADPVTRVRACNLLATSGSVGPRTELVNRFGDPEPDVVLAAMAALQRLACRDVTEEVVQLTEHPNSTVRTRALEILPDLAPPRHFPTQRVGAMLTEDPEPRVRLTAAWALGKRPDDRARKPLIECLRSKEEREIRCAAAASLGGIQTEEVATELLRTSASDASAAVALASRRALNAMPAKIVLSTCGRMLRDADPAIRKETAATLGELNFEGAAALLRDRLSVEKEPLVRAALVEALGHAGATEAWSEVRACVKEEAIVSYSAVCALANLLDEQHLKDFISLLGEVQNETLREAVLKRLALFGRARGLPLSLREQIEPLMRGDHRNLAVLSAEAAGWVRSREMSETLFNQLGITEDPELVRAASASLMRLYDDKTYELVKSAGSAHVKEVALVLDRQKSLGENAPQLCRHLAQLANSQVDGAMQALEAAARVEPSSLAAALVDAPDEEVEVLIRAWHALPPAARDAAPIARANVLRSASAPVRIAALDTVELNSGDEFLPLLVDMAMNDPDNDVRSHAREAMRRVVGA